MISWCFAEQWYIKLWAKKYGMHHRSLDSRIYKTDIQFWAVLGSRGCRERKKPNCHKYATFEASFFYVFIGKK
jgi:hypothetical protein